MKRIGPIGAGIMEESMTHNLRKAGYEVNTYTGTKAKMGDVIAEGTRWCDTVVECAEEQDVVITIIGYLKDVEEIYLSESGIIAGADERTYLIGMTTTSPKPVARIYEEVMKAELYVLDAPMTGGDTDAKAGTLTILTGGNKEMFDACLPMLEAMGKSIDYEGKAGNGQHAKMCN